MSGMYKCPEGVNLRVVIDLFAESLTDLEAVAVLITLKGSRFHNPFGDPVAFDVLESAAGKRISAVFAGLCDRVDAITGLKTLESDLHEK